MWTGAAARPQRSHDATIRVVIMQSGNSASPHSTLSRPISLSILRSGQRQLPLSKPISTHEAPVVNSAATVQVHAGIYTDDGACGTHSGDWSSVLCVHRLSAGQSPVLSYLQTLYQLSVPSEESLTHSDARVTCNSGMEKNR